MKRLKKREFPRLPLWATLVLLVLLTGFITVESLWCQPNALRTVLANFQSQPLLWVLNALPIGGLLASLTCLFRNVWFAGAVVNLGVGVLSIANHVKLVVRDEPVFPRDLSLLKEVKSAVGDFAIQYPVASIAVVLLSTLVFCGLGVVLKSAPFPVRRLRGWLGSLLGTAAGFAVLTGLMVTVYASNDLYNSFRVSNAYYIPSVFNELGFPYCFCHQFTTYPVDKPEGFSKSEAASWAEAPSESGQGKQVHLVMVMNEAFSDITDTAPFAFAADDDPLQNLHALQQDAHAVSGHLVVPGFAGGTANTEFDVLTGMQTNAISASTTSAFRVVNRNLNSVLRVFRDDGYHTAFYHPGDNWFYNRENVYRWLGAEETVFASEMPNLEKKGRWVTDDSFAGFIESKFRQAVDAEQWMCAYATTIQNHMSYTADKYGAEYVFPDVPLNVEVSEQTASLLRVYVEGVRDADAMLGRLKAFFADTEEPVVLAFWGDHLPYLGDNQAGYAELGLEIAQKDNAQTNPTCAYETPYVIWANDAAAEVLDWENAVQTLDLPDSHTISASFLGAALLELTGRGTETPWFSFLNDLRRDLPVVQKTLCQRMDGSYPAALTDAEQAQISKWRKWSYYQLRYQDIAG